MNDADAAICAELWRAREEGRDYRNAAIITIGSGIGIGLVVNGDLHCGSRGLIEGGHMVFHF